MPPPILSTLLLRRAGVSLLAHAEHTLDLGGNIVAQGGDTDRHAGVASRLAKDLQEEIGGSVRDLGLAMERRIGVHIDGKAKAPRDPVEVAIESRTEMSDHIEGREAGGLSRSRGWLFDAAAEKVGL